MTKIINIYTCGLLLSLAACGQTNTKNSNGKVTIKFDDVERVEIKNNPQGQTDEKINLKVLTHAQAKILVNNWNNSKSKGPCKFVLQYWIFFTLKDGTKRTFRTNGPSIKENNNWCYDIGEVHFFKNLYANANPLPEEMKKTFFLIQGLWFHDQDSLASLTINNYQWTFNYEGEQYNPDDNYSISITDKLPEFVKESEKAEFLILSNKTNTLEYEILGLTDSTFSLMYFPAGKIHLYRRKK